MPIGSCVFRNAERQGSSTEARVLIRRDGGCWAATLFRFRPNPINVAAKSTTQRLGLWYSSGENMLIVAILAVHLELQFATAGHTPVVVNVESLIVYLDLEMSSIGRHWYLRYLAHLKHKGAQSTRMGEPWQLCMLLSTRGQGIVPYVTSTNPLPASVYTTTPRTHHRVPVPSPQVHARLKMMLAATSQESDTTAVRRRILGKPCAAAHQRLAACRFTNRPCSAVGPGRAQTQELTRDVAYGRALD